MKSERVSWRARLFGRAPGADGAKAAETALVLFAQGETARVEQVLREACEQFPDQANLHELLGAARLVAGDAPRALASLERAHVLGKPEPARLNMLGLACVMNGAQDRALALFSEAAALDPGHVPAQANAGWLNFAVGNVPASGGYLRRWLRAALPRTRPPGTSRRRLPGVTLCCIDCAYHEMAIHALERSLAQCEFAKALFFTDRDFDIEGVQVVRIDSLKSAADYSNFVIHQLGGYIETEFVLIVQYDGFVLHGAAWDEDFLGYDYIGAKIFLKDGFVVGNGGFSLRSQKLLRAMQDPLLAQYDAHTSSWQEDMAICVQHRAHLEREYGIRFAPGELADRFAVEASLPTLQTFGFHNLVQLGRLVDTDFAADAAPGTRAMPIRLRADTPFGPFHIETSVELGGGGEFDQQVAQHRQGSAG